MKMKKRLAALLAAGALSVSMLAGCGGQPAGTPSDGESGDETKTPLTAAAGKLHMSTNAAFPPYEMVADGEGYNGTGFEGIDVEIACAIAEKLDLELVVDDMSFDSALAAAGTGKSDMVMAGVTVDDERLLTLNFTTSYAKGVQVVIVPDGSDIATVDDLDGKQIGVQRNTTGHIYCRDQYGDEKVTAYENGATAVQALKNGQVDCVVIDNLPANEYVRVNAGLKILDTKYADEDYAIGIAKNNTALLEAVDGALQELIADGTVQRIVDKYIPAEE